MAVPETAVNENHCMIFGQDEIRRTFQQLGVKRETEAQTVKAGANDSLRLCVTRPYAGHHPAACWNVNNISHALPVSLAVLPQRR